MALQFLARVRFCVKNTFVEMDVEADENEREDRLVRNPRQRRAQTLPAVPVPSMIEESDLPVKSLSDPQDCGQADGLLDDQEDGIGSPRDFSQDYHFCRTPFSAAPSPRFESMHADDGFGENEGVLGRVWLLSQEADGCRIVQRALESAGEEEQIAIARELQGHVWDALEHPHANFVLQKMIVTLDPASAQFVLDEILGCGSASVAAQSRYGCRVIQRLFECGNHAQVSAVGEDLLKRALLTCKHRFGRYVMQCFAEHGLGPHVRELVEILAQEISTVCLDEFASSVVSRLLAPGTASAADQQLLGLAVLRSPGLAAQLRRWRTGTILVNLAVDIARGCGDLAVAENELLPPAPALNLQTSKRQRRGSGGGNFAQATAEARDIIESLKIACRRRHPQRIAKSILRLEAAAAAPDAVPLLIAEGPRACMAARAYLEQLTEEGVAVRA